MKQSPKLNILFYIVVIVLLCGTVYTIAQRESPKSRMFHEVVNDFKNANVKRFDLKDQTLTYITKDDQSYNVKLYSVDIFYRQTEQYWSNVGTWDLVAPMTVPQWMMFAPYLILIAIMAFLWYFMLGRGGMGGGGAGAMNFKRANPRVGPDTGKKKTFSDVEGANEEKEELSEVVDFLKNPKKYSEIGARIPSGVLLVGPPGTGKTLLAKAVAGEAGVQFLSISGSDFVELYVGVGASRVRSLFEEAKKNSPCIIFIDEIDAVGRHRGAGMGGGHDEREQTLNQLLVEMDGFVSNEGIIIMAATNRPDILDPALLRPGRFDRQVYLGHPDIRGRENILRLHAKNKPCDETIELSVIAKQTAGFTGADLENLLNESALLAARRNKALIGMDEVSEAMLKVIAGPAKRSRKVSEKERKLTAYHEAGHAVVMRNLKHCDPVHHISIIPRGMAGGMTVALPEEDKSFTSKSEMLDNIVSFLGGRVAEQLVLDDISTGASNDIQRATAVARNMVTKYGMSERIGAINYRGEHDEVFLGRDFTQTRVYSEATGALIDAEIKSIIDKAYDRCEGILKDSMDVLHKIAAYLLDNETMDASVFETYFDTPLDPDAEPVLI